MALSIESEHPIAPLWVVTTPKQPGVFQATADDDGSGVAATLAEHGTEVFRVGSHRAIRYVGLHPHHPDPVDHQIVWTDRANGHAPHLSPWDESDWRRLAEDKYYLEEMERRILDAQHKDPQLRAYMFVGFSPRGRRPATAFTFSQAGQSQKWPHFHQLPSFVLPEDINTRPYARKLDLNNPRDQLLYVLFLDRVGEASIEYFSDKLQRYGTRFIFHQPLGPERRVRHTRILFGSSSLFDALGAWEGLKADIQNTGVPWKEHAKAIVEPLWPDSESPTQGLAQSYKQTAVPVCALIYPNRDDANVGNVPEGSGTVWSKPLTVFPMAQATLSDGGVIFDR